jgi:hypothetical protein
MLNYLDLDHTRRIAIEHLVRIPKIRVDIRMLVGLRSSPDLVSISFLKWAIDLEFEEPVMKAERSKGCRNVEETTKRLIPR